MLDKLFKLQETKPWLFYLLFVPLFPIIVIWAYKKYLGHSVKNTVEDAEKKDKELAKEQLQAEARSQQSREDAKKHEENIEKINNQDDADWHKKL